MCGIDDMTQMNISTARTHSYRPQTVAAALGGGGEAGKDGEFGINRCEPLQNG